MGMTNHNFSSCWRCKHLAGSAFDVWAGGTPTLSSFWFSACVVQVTFHGQILGTRWKAFEGGFLISVRYSHYFAHKKAAVVAPAAF